MSPGATWLTPSPVATTSPVASWPSMKGPGTARGPCIWCSCEWQMPEAKLRTSTSPGPGSPYSTSSTRRGWPGSVKIAAFDCMSWLPFALLAPRRMRGIGRRKPV